MNIRNIGKSLLFNQVTLVLISDAFWYINTLVLQIHLDSSAALGDDNLEISGYNLERSDHPSNNKRGRVCLYYKNILSFHVFDTQYLQECINFELKIKFVAHYRSLASNKKSLKSLPIMLN